ncbi:hypothetical protein B0H11DRAFT_1902496 [Mycena galericulata]|nr:hypothetical protein B0H11DRAFT_1902496 [Mycena galericulata]
MKPNGTQELSSTDGRENEVHLEEFEDDCDSFDDTDAKAKELVKAPAKETAKKRKAPSAPKKDIRKTKAFEDEREDLSKEMDAVEGSSDDTDQEAKQPVKALVKRSGKKRKESEQMDAGSDNAYAKSENDKKAKQPPARKRSPRVKNYWQYRRRERKNFHFEQFLILAKELSVSLSIGPSETFCGENNEMAITTRSLNQISWLDHSRTYSQRTRVENTNYDVSRPFSVNIKSPRPHRDPITTVRLKTGCFPPVLDPVNG